MMTAADALTIQPVPTPVLNIPGVSGVGTTLSQPTAVPQVAQLDPNAAFSQAANGSVLLPFNSTAPQPPTGAQLFPDPAAIILPNQNLFVGDVNLIQQDCALVAAGSLFNLQQQLLAAEAIAQAELAGVILGNAAPPTIIINNNGNGNGQNNNNNNNNNGQNNNNNNNGQDNNNNNNNDQNNNGQNNTQAGQDSQGQDKGKNN